MFARVFSFLSKPTGLFRLKHILVRLTTGILVICLFLGICLYGCIQLSTYSRGTGNTGRNSWTISVNGFIAAPTDEGASLKHTFGSWNQSCDEGGPWD